MPDPALSAWKREDERLGKKGVPKRNRPSEPNRNPNYPTKVELGLDLLRQFQETHREITVKVILADALYGESRFLDQAGSLWGEVQVISQLHKNQNIWYRGRKRTLEDYFNSINWGVIQTLLVRGQQETQVWISSARLKVDAHGKKRFVIAVKYQDEENYRYLVVADLSWRTQDIIQAYTLRWLVEVFFEDWKLYEGWGREAKQLDEEGSS
ncbi:transposase family protein [Thioploca ingrica]|uniref:Transposase family protein n=1 Tax=Thioploca ingrica TaxID=40754 RepID=A0A090AH19_9GAMM|nr:transposase family protein [Thioploca ingrica]